MSDIDKDIEIVKENIDDGTIYVRCGFTLNQAIENVLKELDTYKKIAEFLADEGEFNSNKYCDEDGLVCMVKHPERECTKCIIEWARKEVEDEIHS